MYPTKSLTTETLLNEYKPAKASKPAVDSRPVTGTSLDHEREANGGQYEGFYVAFTAVVIL
jgi:hypothetical protein